ncbi:hyaluronoglucosaminidase [Tumebacillus sp. BK434]|uniref:protein O-GlcNAcase n=1 Tax=Tumebacillus sp. BK434 TaxID=2512169 RepID=UPI00105215B6|nr:protein O-GlcNAcase [Tumebacillus sp. BK434]TCP59235.1 hyaluronoglucosaminidase [Tumebacillus sp. BK434]
MKRTVIWAGVFVAALGAGGLWYVFESPQPQALPQAKQTAAAPLEQLQADAKTAQSFAIRGVIEGFYGAPWTHEQRLSMFEFMSRNHYNTYVYAPKDDPYQRMDWALPYPEQQAGKMRELIQKAEAGGLRFVYSISPGIPLALPNKPISKEMYEKSILFSSEDDRKRLSDKVAQLQGMGVKTIMLSFDDVQDELKDKDRGIYGTNYAEAHMQLANALLADGKKKDPGFELWFAPTRYWGVKDHPYWQTLREQLDPAISVIWTGPEILSKKIDSADADKVAQLLGRKPLIWDNYPVNDYTYAIANEPQLFFGPLEARSEDLQAHVSGLLANPMVQPESSKPALYSISKYLQNPAAYDPEKSYVEGLSELKGVGKSGLFNKFTDYSRRSMFAEDEWNPKFKELVDAEDTARLKKEFDELKGLRGELQKSTTNKQLLKEIDPWLMKLSREGELGLLTLRMLAAAPGTPERAELTRQTEAELNKLKQEPYKIGEEILTFVDLSLQKQ